MIFALSFSRHTKERVQVVVLYWPYNMSSAGLVTTYGFCSAARAGMGGITRTEQVAKVLQGKAVRTKVGEVLAILIVVAELSTLLDGGHQSKVAQGVVCQGIAGHIRRGTGHWRLSIHGGKEQREENQQEG